MNDATVPWTIAANMTTTLGADAFGVLENKATLTVNGSASTAMDSLF